MSKFIWTTKNEFGQQKTEIWTSKKNLDVQKNLDIQKNLVAQKKFGRPKIIHIKQLHTGGPRVMQVQLIRIPQARHFNWLYCDRYTQQSTNLDSKQLLLKNAF